MKDIIIAPSILASDFLHLEDEIRRVEKAGLSWIHFDVMDGHLVNNISFGIPLLKAVNECTALIKDVHLMIANPKKYAKAFIENGADYITFHYEAMESEREIVELIDLIHDEGKKVGISIKPSTEIEKIFPYLPLVDMVLVMSVEPGFGGQEFIVSSTLKIMKLKDYLNTHEGVDFLIEVDGGINDVTGPVCLYYGANVLVAGTYLFKSLDMKEAASELILKHE